MIDAFHKDRGLVTLAVPLDLARAMVLRAAGRSGRILLAQRSVRVAVYAALGLLMTLLLACFAPLWAFAVGPIILGVPHLLADVRYLVVRPGLHRRSTLVCAVGIPLLIGTIDGSAALALSAGFGALLFARAARPSARVARWLLVAAWAVVVALAVTHRTTASLVVLHGHNAVAVLLFLFAFARSRRVGIAIAIGASVTTIAILAGMFDPWLMRSLASGPRTGLDIGAVLDTIAPLSDPVLATRLAIVFIFAQGFHYVLWLRLVPEEARERPGLRSFSSSVRALEHEMGKPVLVLFALFAAIVAARATFSLETARMFYLRASGFHAYVEIAFALLFVVEGRPRS